MLIKNWIAVRKQNFTKPDGANDDTLESDMLIDEMFIINEMSQMQNIGGVKSEYQHENSSSSNQFGSGLFPKVEIKQEYDASGNGSEFADDESRSNQKNEKSSTAGNGNEGGQEFSSSEKKLDSKNNSAAKKNLRFPCSMCSKR